MRGGGKSGKGKGGGKSGGKSTAKNAPKSKVRMPSELIGMSSTTPKGDHICFAYNLKSGCSSKKKDGEQCDRGWHVCMVPGCGASHSVPNH